MQHLVIFGFDLGKYIDPEMLGHMLRSGLLLVIGLPLIKWLARWVHHLFKRRYSAQHGMIADKVVYYTGLAYIVISIMAEFNFPISHLLGAMGVVGIALGFASQTSVSNIISGLFLMAEKPFVVGDLLKIGTTTGEVLSIDTLSIKLRTFDNQFVRIPNESIIKTEVTNLTRFPIRRVDLQVGVAYKEDMGRVRDILLDLADRNPLILREPEPLVIFTGFGNSSLDMLFAVWAVKTNWLKAKNEMMESIKKRFDEEGIEIPFPHISLYTGSVTDPFPVKLVAQAGGDGAGESKESGH